MPKRNPEDAAPPAKRSRRAADGERDMRRHQQQIAERIAERFARSSHASTTPTGRLKSSQHASVDEKENWPGPFATALAFMKQRESARAAREQQLAKSGKEGDDDERGEEEQLDAYDSALSVLQQTNSHLFNDPPATLPGHWQVEVPSLADLCINTLAAHADTMEYAWERLPADQLHLLSQCLAKTNQLVLSVVLPLTQKCDGILDVADCSQLDEEMLLQCMNALFRGTDEATASKSHRRVMHLKLINCGRCFSDRVAAALAHHLRPRPSHCSTHSLQSLETVGCYKLSDSGLVTLLDACDESLVDLDLSCSNRLASQGLRRLCTLRQLQSLVIDHCSLVTDKDLAVLCEDSSNCLPALTKLSAVGLVAISDAFVEDFLRLRGGGLTYLNLSECSILSSAAVASIRSHCWSLEMLLLGNLGDVDTLSWMGLFVVNALVEGGARDSTAEGSHHPHVGTLKLVDISNNGNVTDDVVVVLCESYRVSLTNLSLKACPQLTNRAAAAIARNGLEDLAVLNISFVRKIGVLELTWCVLQCPSLHTLHMWGNSQMCVEVQGAVSKGKYLLWNNAAIQKRNVRFVGRPRFL